MKKLKLALLALSITLFNCSDDVETVNNNSYNGYFVLNEGGFMQSNSSFSFMSNDFSQFNADLYTTVNPTQIMGDVAQSMYIYEDKMYVIINNSNKIIILNRYTTQQIGTIVTGVINPRYLVVNNNTIYVSCWGDPSITTDDYIAVIRLNFLTELPKILVPEGPEKLLVHNNKIYVAHKGGYGFGNKISVINTTNNTVSNTINTGDLPSGMAIHNNQLHVFCSGKPSYSSNETGGKFVSYSLSDYSQTQSLNYNTNEHPSNFCEDSNFLYYTLGNAIYKKDISSNSLPIAPLFTPQVTYFYGLNVYENQIFVCDAKNFISAGSLKVFNQSGGLITEKTTEIAPNGVYKN